MSAIEKLKAENAALRARIAERDEQEAIDALPMESDMYRLIFTGSSAMPRICVHEQDMPLAEASAIAASLKAINSLGTALGESYWSATLYNVQTGTLIKDWTFKRGVTIKE